MRVKVESLISKEPSNFGINAESKMFSQIFGTDYDDNFQISTVKSDDIVILAANKDTYTWNLSDFVQDPTKICMVAIVCHKVVETTTDEPISIKFKLTVNTVELTKTAQFTLVNMKDNLITEITIDTFDIATDTKAVLSIVIGLKD